MGGECGCTHKPREVCVGNETTKETISVSARTGGWCSACHIQFGSGASTHTAISGLHGQRDHKRDQKRLSSDGRLMQRLPCTAWRYVNSPEIQPGMQQHWDVEE